MSSNIVIRPCCDADIGTLVEIINEAATAYHGGDPDDCLSLAKLAKTG